MRNGECRAAFAITHYALERVDGKKNLSGAATRALLDLTGPSAKAMRRAALIGASGQRFVHEELSDDVLDCYWAEALIRYGMRAQQLKGREQDHDHAMDAKRGLSPPSGRLRGLGKDVEGSASIDQL